MLISVIIPVAKTQFLRKAIESVINQTYTDWEIIMIDDQLDKNVILILSQFLPSEKIRFYKTHKNLGLKDPTQTWNFGLRYANGDYAVLLGDDDYISVNYLEKMVNLAKKYPKFNIYRSRLAIIDNHDQIIEYGLSLPEFEKWDELLYYRNIYGRWQSTSEIMFNVNEMNRIGGFISFPLGWASDDATWLSLALEKGIISTNETYACFRRHSKSISNNVDLKQFRKIEDIFIAWCLNFIEKNYSSTHLSISKKHLIDSLNNRSAIFGTTKSMKLNQLITLIAKILRQPLRKIKNDIGKIINGKL